MRESGGDLRMMLPMTIAAAMLANVVGWASIPPQPSDPSPAGARLFEESAAPILEKHCVECHTGPLRKAGFEITTREGLLLGGDYGPAIVSGKSKESLMIVLLRHEDEPYMPEDKPKLPDADIASLAAWIDAGAPYTRPLKKPPSDPAKQP